MDYEKLAEQMAEAIEYMDPITLEEFVDERIEEMLDAKYGTASPNNTLDMTDVKDSGVYIDMTHDAREYKNKILALNGMTPEQNR